MHEIEAFGPVASVLAYDTVDEAGDLVALGGGSLVTSVATSDPAVAATLLARIAAFNGRLLFLDRDDLRSSTGHGSPVPHLVHGGPGRAGGGEELGGIRAVLHHMQRTALQGSPEMLTALTGVWHQGAAARSDRHPFRKSLDELRIGDQIASASRSVSLEDIETFAHFTGDTFYAHMDEEAAAANPFFPGRVAHGYLLVSWAAGLFVDPDPGPVLANYGLENLRFITPVSPGDEIRVVLTAKQITPRETDEYGEVRWDAVILNQREEIVATYDVLTLVAKHLDELGDRADEVGEHVDRLRTGWRHDRASHDAAGPGIRGPRHGRRGRRARTIGRVDARARRHDERLRHHPRRARVRAGRHRLRDRVQRGRAA